MLFGLPNAGKTSLMSSAFLDLDFTEISNLKPTKGISREDFVFDIEIDLNMWDLGGAEKYITRYFSITQRELIFSEVNIGIFVVDSTDMKYSPKQMFDEFIFNIFSFSPYVELYVLLNKIDLKDSQENLIIKLLSSGLDITILKRIEFAHVSIKDGSAKRKFIEIIKLQVQNRLLNKKHEEIELYDLKRALDIHGTDFHNYCVSCNRRLHNRKSPGKYKNFKILTLRFCCSCYEEYENKTMDEFPKSFIRALNKKVKDYFEFKNEM